jgi:hypothetical protein
MGLVTGQALTRAEAADFAHPVGAELAVLAAVGE